MRKIKILVVEDEAIIARYLTMELELEGYEVCGYVGSGEEAVEKMKKENLDLILMDINLKGKIDGIDAAEQIQNLKKIPIIFMTGYSRLEYSERAAKLNPLGYLNKPIEVENIKPLVEKHFGG